MSTNIATIPDNALAVGISQQLWDALTSSIYPGARPESVVMVYQYCKARQLDPLKKPVHIVPMSVKNMLSNRYEYRDVIMPGIQELRTTASRTNLMGGQEPPVFGEKITVPITDDPSVKEPVTLTVPESCTITVYRLDANGKPRPYTHVEFFEEAVARTKDGAINTMWRKRPRGQLTKCAEAGALRKAFPEELGGIHSAEEMEGRVIGEGVIEGEFGVVSKGEEIPMPEEVETAAAPPQDTKPTKAQDKPKAEAKPETKPAAAQYEVKTGAPPPAEEKPAAAAPAGLKIELDAGPHRVLTSRLQTAGLTEAQLLEGFGKSVSIGNINEVFTWIKEQQG